VRDPGPVAAAVVGARDLDPVCIEPQRDGAAPLAAIRQACLLRFRPIMMTTVAALLTGLPLMLDRGAGSEFRNPLGVAMVGGLLLSQALTLYTTPVVYLYLDALQRRLAPGRRARVPILAQRMGAAGDTPAQR